MGYAGGSKEQPSYHSMGDHTESLQVIFDPSKVTYEELLAIFWSARDHSRQAWSRQYWNICFYHNEEQRKAAEAASLQMANRTGRKVQTPLMAAGTFWPAEDYHQKYRLRGESSLATEIKSYFADELSFAKSTAAARINGYLAGYGSAKELEDNLSKLGLSKDGQRLLERRHKTYRKY